MNKEELIKLIIEEMKRDVVNRGLVEATISDKELVTGAWTSSDVLDMLAMLDLYLDDEHEIFKQPIDEHGLVVDIDNAESYEYYYKITLSNFVDCNKRYDILIGFVDDMCGYCECTPDEEGYNKKHKCCGECCDWYIPTFEIIERKTINYKMFEGKQKDLWEAQDNFVERYFGKDSLIEQERKKEREQMLRDIEYFEDMIKILKEKLQELDKE